ncbi:SIMPL domain-containing protein [Streptomyces albidochromogenes]|uniref:SIMPL domain-containing protein n=1 Tax=Streptomyces albidochromogenes TaxID=329524 RepID=A0ABW6FGC8_9ACTN
MSVRTALTAAALTGGLLVGAAAPVLVAAPAAAASLSAPPASSHEIADRDREATTVSVNGEGRATAAPDMAVLAVAVEATEPTAKRALAAQSVAAEAVLAAVRRQGIADRDVQTESLSLNPVYQHTDRAASKLTGYQAGQAFSVRIRDLARTGAVVEAVTAAAGDAARINGVTFDVADPSALRARAREAAHADARTKAEQYARLSGRGLGRLVSVTETGSGTHRPVEVPGAAFEAGKVPVAPGEIRDEVAVTAVYELY